MNITRITSLAHPEVKRWVRLRQEAQTRLAEGRVLVQGKKVVAELISMGYPLRNLLVTKELLPSYPDANATWLVTEEIMKKVTGVQSTEGIAAEVDLPLTQSLLDCSWILVLDGVSDPGNVGTLLRTADALGWEGIYLLPGSCDPYNDKALRASMGATFHLKCRSGSYEELMDLHKHLGYPCYSADLNGRSVESVAAQKPLRAALLVLGSESHGISPQMSLFNQPLTIPMQPHADSLNVAVAGGILLYMLRKG